MVVVCLTLPNDLSRWDSQAALREAERPGAFVLASALFGRQSATARWDYALLERSVTAEGLANLDRQLPRLAELARAVPMLLLVYAFDDPTVNARLARIPRAVVARAGLRDSGDRIPGDGHPTGSGNRKTAALLADALVSTAPLASESAAN